MMIARPLQRRAGFTLLEVMLASAIAVLLLSGLYFAFDLCLRQTDAARTIAENSDITRAIVNRMTVDLSGSLGPLPPKSGGGIQQAETTATPAATPSVTTPTTGTGTTETPAEGETTTTESAAAADVPFQGGVFGTDKQLTLYVSRVPTDMLNPESAAQTFLGSDPKPDLRRITYYLSATGGLCRQEQFLVTADGIRNSTDPDHSRESLDVIADEVTDVTFEYFDGTSWSSTWAGDDEGDDGNTVKGPPRAIRMTLILQDEGGESKRVEHVFAVRAAVGTYKPPESETTTTDTTTEGM